MTQYKPSRKTRKHYAPSSKKTTKRGNKVSHLSSVAHSSMIYNLHLRKCIRPEHLLKAPITQTTIDQHQSASSHHTQIAFVPQLHRAIQHKNNRLDRPNCTNTPKEHRNPVGLLTRIKKFLGLCFSVTEVAASANANEKKKPTPPSSINARSKQVIILMSKHGVRILL